MSALDLQSPIDLERAENLTAAAARAISGRGGLRYRRHLLHLGRRLVAARAPFVHPDVEAQTMDDLRGATDAMAMWVAHTDPWVLAEFRPEDPFEELIFEILEQFRVEALIPEAQRGTRRNVHDRFHRWSHEFIEDGLLENDLGVLLFTVIHVCRSRILAEPMEERVNDHTEATRAGIYEILGTRLRQLRPCVHDQRAFSEHSVEIARAVGELAAQIPAGRHGARPAASLLAMLEFDDAQDLDLDAVNPPSAGRVRATPESGYEAFTTEFDRTVPVGELVLPHAQRVTREELDAIETPLRPLGAYIARRAALLFPAPIDSTWESEQEFGWLDPRLLSRLATGSTDGNVFRTQTPADRPAAAVTFLVDCSGSMKANIGEVAALVDLLVRALDRRDVVTEVLGFTTGAWNGGRAHQRWLAEGRKPHPGRLNEVCQIVFKDAATTWRRARASLSAMIWTPMFREGIDGEALEWAYERLRMLDAPHRMLVVVSDGSPMDGATTLTNDERYLDRHFHAVAQTIEADPDVQVLGLGIGHDMSTFFSSSRIVDPEAIAHRGVAATILDFLAQA